MRGKINLNVNEMDQVAGGYIVDRGFWYDYWIVDDRRGEVLETCFLKGDAEAAADRHGVRYTVISEETYKEVFRK